MRWLGVPCAFALGCGFSSPRVGPDAGGDPPDDAAGMDAPTDGMTTDDGPPANPVRTRRIDITDAQVTGGPHTAFPLLVAITAPWLRTTAAGGNVANASGFDLGFFADAAGTMRLAHELEAYRGDTGALLAWVKVPSLSPTSELFLRYGDPAITTSQENVAAVWSNGFAAVWHLSATLGDATANGNTGASSGTTATGGQIGEARGFDATDDFVDLGSAASIDDVFAGGGTVEAWFRASGWGESSRGKIVEKNDASTGSGVAGWSLGVDDVNVSESILFGHGSTAGSGGFWNAPAGSVALNKWTHVAVVYDQGSTANNPSIYLDGAAVTVSETNAPGGAMASDASYAGRLGNRVAGDRTFNGRLDEVRLSTSSRSPGWIATSVANQADPDAFYTVGPEL